MASTRRKRRLQVVIRGYEPSDAEAVAAIYRSDNVRRGTLQMPYQSVAEIAERYGAMADDTRLLVAEVSSKVVALGGIHLSTRQRTRYSASLGMSVAEGSQGRGVGGALLDALISLAERWCGVLRLELAVYVDNAEAIALYSSREFEIEGVARAYALRDGEAVDAFHMARVSPNLPWPRVTAEEAAKRAPLRLTAGPDRKKGNGGSGSKRGSGSGWR